MAGDDEVLRVAHVTFGSTDKVQGQVLWHSLCALRRGAAMPLLVFCGHVGRSVSREGRRDPDHVIGDSEAQPSGRPNTSSPAECLRATQWPACGRQPRGVGKQYKRDSFSVWKQRGPCSRGKRRHRVPRLATSQLVGFILGYHSGRLRILLLVARPLQTRVLVQSAVLPLRRHFDLRRHWLKCGDTATPWRLRNPTAYRLAAK